MLINYNEAIALEETLTKAGYNLEKSCDLPQSVVDMLYAIHRAKDAHTREELARENFHTVLLEALAGYKVRTITELQLIACHKLDKPITFHCVRWHLDELMREGKVKITNDRRCTNYAGNAVCKHRGYCLTGEGRE